MANCFGKCWVLRPSGSHFCWGSTFRITLFAALLGDSKLCKALLLSGLLRNIYTTHELVMLALMVVWG